MKKKDPAFNLVPKITSIREESGKILSKFPSFFPEYTDHSIDHKDRVLENYDIIISDKLLRSLDVYELYFLVAATYLHDIGMVNLKGLSSHSVSREATVDDQRDYIRKFHHLRAEEFIKNQHKYLGIEKHEAAIIGIICKGHRVEDLRDPKYFPQKLPFKTNHTVNVALLSLLLRVADELDLTFQRIPQILLDFSMIETEHSRLEWIRQENTFGISLDKDDPLTITAFAECDDPKIYRLLKKIEDKLNLEISNLPLVLSFHSEDDLMKSIVRRFSMKIETHGFLPYDFKFSADKNVLIELLGQRLYHDPSEAIREVLKNAIDTCRYKTKLAGSVDYTPKISVTYNKDEKELIVSDNGLGMDKYHIKNFFTVIGKSFYKSNDFVRSNVDLVPLSELGIGVLSYFLISDKIEIDTKFKGSQPLKIIIDNQLDYFLVYPSEREHEGTVIKLYLKEELFVKSPYENLKTSRFDFTKKNFIYDIIRYYAPHVEIPIHFTSSNVVKVIKNTNELSKMVNHLNNELQKLSELPNENIRKKHWSESLKELRKSYGLREIPSIHLVYKCIDDDEMSGFIGLLVAKTKNNEVFPWLDLDLGGNEILHRTSVKGILIDNSEFFDDRYVYDRSIIYDIDLKKHIELDTSRNSIINDKEWLKISNKLIEYLCQLIEDNLSKRPKVTNDRDYNSHNQMLYYIMHSKDYTLEIPSVKQLFKRFLLYRCVSKGKTEYLSCAQVTRSRDIIGVYSRRYLDQKVVNEIIHNNPLFRDDKRYIIDYYNDIGWEFIPDRNRMGLRQLMSSKNFEMLFLKNTLDHERGPAKERIFKRLSI
ncbi:MAG: hypothetical protein AB7V56_08650 [Candidatus Nitrosocosmicus sp.]